MASERKPQPEETERVPVVVPDGLVLAETGESPTVEVRVWQHGKLIHRELCESVEIAADITNSWNEFDDIECEVDDLSVPYTSEDRLEPPAGSANGNGDREHSPRV